MSYMQLIPLLISIGIAGGFLSGLLGIGGGIVFVPALYFCLVSYGLDAELAIRMAVGTSMALVLVTGASSAFWHHKKSAVDFSILKSWGPYIVLGVTAGTFFSAAIDGHFLKRLFATVVILIAAYMAFSKEAATEPTAHRIKKPVQRAGAAVIGMISSLIGMGGAIMTVPFMTYIGVPMRKAIGTGTPLGMLISFPATIGYVISGLHATTALPPWSFGYVNGLVVLAVTPFSLLLSPLGVRISHTLPRNALRRIFAVVLIVVSLRMFWS